MVTRHRHTHAGKTYRVGETFEGSARLLAVFSDRLAPADQRVKTSVDLDKDEKPKRHERQKKVKDDADTSDSE
jgi:hypothetical protein